MPTVGLVTPNVQVQGRAADRRSVPCNAGLGLAMGASK
ncbi:hypothetical protein GALL_337090 [mine drainage metagenome]|uniref:Uncharacterized protein n=1 Tax=mine drainage metagenome TaxID=410659 RepID=A0A1J5QLV7_9ZZZZ